MIGIPYLVTLKLIRTMKKTYIAPVLDVELADMTESILTVSKPNLGIGNGTVDAAEVEVKEDAWDIWEE